MRLFIEILKGLLPILIVVGVLGFALAPIDNPVFDYEAINENHRWER